MPRVALPDIGSNSVYLLCIFVSLWKCIRFLHDCERNTLSCHEFQVQCEVCAVLGNSAVITRIKFTKPTP